MSKQSARGTFLHTLARLTTTPLIPLALYLTFVLLKTITHPIITMESQTARYLPSTLVNSPHNPENPSLIPPPIKQDEPPSREVDGEEPPCPPAGEAPVLATFRSKKQKDEARPAFVTCKALTSRNQSQCKRPPIQGGEYCKVHQDQIDRVDTGARSERVTGDTSASAVCTAKTTRGGNCTFKAVGPHGFCHIHRWGGGGGVDHFNCACVCLTRSPRPSLPL